MFGICCRKLFSEWTFFWAEWGSAHSINFGNESSINDLRRINARWTEIQIDFSFLPFCPLWPHRNDTDIITCLLGINIAITSICNQTSVSLNSKWIVVYINRFFSRAQCPEWPDSYGIHSHRIKNINNHIIVIDIVNVPL